MKFVDYYFDLWPDGSIKMDEELKPEMIDVRHGDIFTIEITDDNKVIFRKDRAWEQK